MDAASIAVPSHDHYAIVIFGSKADDHAQLGRIEEMEQVVEALLAKDIAPADVAKIVGGNHMRVFKAVSAAASA